MTIFGFGSDRGPFRKPVDAFPDPAVDLPPDPSGEAQTAVLGGGCFWCVEAVYRNVDGVLDVVSGYAGGTAETANYRAVCSGTTDHAEVVRVRFDPARVSFGQILKLFFSVAHDPTQVDRQGADVGRQYRSAVFYADQRQKEVTEAYIRQIDAEGMFRQPIATTVEPLTGFYEAEGYHQDYAAQNPGQPYIAYNVSPKLEKLNRYYGDRVRKSG